MTTFEFVLLGLCAIGWITALWLLVVIMEQRDAITDLQLRIAFTHQRYRRLIGAKATNGSHQPSASGEDLWNANLTTR